MRGRLRVNRTTRRITLRWTVFMVLKSFHVRDHEIATSQLFLHTLIFQIILGFFLYLHGTKF